MRHILCVRLAKGVANPLRTQAQILNHCHLSLKVYKLLCFYRCLSEFQLIHLSNSLTAFKLRQIDIVIQDRFTGYS